MREGIWYIESFERACYDAVAWPKTYTRRLALPFFFLVLVLVVAKSRFWLDRKNSPRFGSGFTSQVTQHEPYRWCRRYVACSLMLPTAFLLPRLTSMSLAPTNTLLL